MAAIVPKKVIVAVDIDTNRKGIASFGAGGVAILTPLRVGCLIVANTIGVDYRELAPYFFQRLRNGEDDIRLDQRSEIKRGDGYSRGRI